MYGPSGTELRQLWSLNGAESSVLGDRGWGPFLGVQVQMRGERGLVGLIGVIQWWRKDGLEAI